MSKTFEELVAEQMPGEGEFIEFDGFNCNDVGDPDAEPCPGWDGISHRCECGNRRVSWEQEGDEVYARAH